MFVGPVVLILFKIPPLTTFSPVVVGSGVFVLIAIGGVVVFAAVVFAAVVCAAVVCAAVVPVPPFRN